MFSSPREFWSKLSTSTFSNFYCKSKNNLISLNTLISSLENILPRQKNYIQAKNYLTSMAYVSIGCGRRVTTKKDKQNTIENLDTIFSTGLIFIYFDTILFKIDLTLNQL